MLYLPHTELFFLNWANILKIQISGFSWNISRSGQTGPHSHGNDQLKLRTHCPSDRRGSPIHHVPMTLCLYPTVSVIWHLSLHLKCCFFYGEKIFLCTHGSIKGGKIKHKPKRLCVSKKNRESIFLNGIKNYSDKHNSQSIPLSISLTPALFLVYILCPCMLLSLQSLRTWGPRPGIQI